jgi:hypothetical protein
MVVIVTPYLVDTTTRDALKLPGDAMPMRAGGEIAGNAVALSSAREPDASDKGFGFIIE